MRKAVVALVVLALLTPTAVVLAWQIDVATAGPRLQRGVVVGEAPVGRAGPDTADDVVAEVAEAFGRLPVTVNAEDRSVTAPAADWGLRVDTAATLAALQAQRDRRSPAGFPGWARSWIGSRTVTPTLTVDEAAARATLARLDTAAGADPAEPTVVLGGDGFVAVPGAPGRRIDPADTVEALRRARWGTTPLTVSAGIVTTPPATTDDEAATTAAALTSATATPIALRVREVVATLPPDVLRSVVRPAARRQDVTVDGPAAVAALAALVPDPVTPAVPDTIAIVDGLPAAVGGIPGTRCCDPDGTAAALLAALGTGAPPPGPVEVPGLLFTEGPPKELRALGIVEEIGRFTTPHKAGEARVINIHRAADALRGTIVAPGEILSLNGILGERTSAKGYVAAPAIVGGRLTPQVGGGVSQVATTVFNAAFFAGLELVEYQAHSLYISRYPYGREATVFWPGLDLKVRNTTPASMLVWTEYTDTEITVVLYGTRAWQQVEQGAQTQGPAGRCTLVRTERVKTAFDGTVHTDTITARYRPGEGVNC